MDNLVPSGPLQGAIFDGIIAIVIHVILRRKKTESSLYNVDDFLSLKFDNIMHLLKIAYADYSHILGPGTFLLLHISI